MGEISVVVPTRDRPESLRSCLRALRREGTELELIVVDDGSRRADEVAAVASEAGARLVSGEGHGPAAARNRGAEAARGDVVLFTDDDCEPVVGWALALTGAAELHGTAAGRTVPPPGAGPAVVASQTVIDHLMAEGVPVPGEPLAFAPSCNLGCRRDVASRLPFDERFELAAGEDREWSARAAAAGLAPRFVADALVVHRLAGGLRPFAARQWRYGRGAAQLRRLGVPLSSAGSRRRLVRRGFAAGPATGGLVLAAQALTGAGAVAARRG